MPRTLTKPEEIEEYYKDKGVVDSYVKKRHGEPIFKVEHDIQVAILNKIIARYKPKKILEVALGPARLTKDISPKSGIAIDSSEEMIKLAKKILERKGKNWKLIKGDAFNTKLKKNSFDMVFSFRFVFHFKRKKREKFYKEVKRVLKDKGIFVFEALNKKKVKPVRKFVGEKKYNVFSELFYKKDLINELEENGFKVIRIYPHISHFWTEMAISRFLSAIGLSRLAEIKIRFMERFTSNNPYEWVILCQKR